jgi:hypothetical protein
VSGAKARLPGGPCCFVSVLALLMHTGGLRASGGQTLAAIMGNGTVNDGAAIHAFPGIEDEKEIREPL